MEEHHTKVPRSNSQRVAHCKMMQIVFLNRSIIFYFCKYCSLIHYELILLFSFYYLFRFSLKCFLNINIRYLRLCILAFKVSLFFQNVYYILRSATKTVFFFFQISSILDLNEDLEDLFVCGFYHLIQLCYTSMMYLTAGSQLLSRQP